MIRIHVLSGGNSAEREVSLRSGAAVAKALTTTDYEVKIIDPFTTDIEAITDCDVVFPVLHGVGGEDGTLQAKLEASNMPFVGSGSKASEICIDKWRYHEFLKMHALPMPQGALVQAETYATHPIAKQTHVLKPIAGGSSIDTYIVRDPADIPTAEIAESFTRFPTMLLEELIVGTELTVGILGEEPLPVIEIIPPADGEFDYENKYNGKTQELCPPEHVGENVQRAAQALALQAHKLTGCRDFSRTDIMVEKSGKLFLLETNTIPGMTEQSLFPKMAAAAGVTMPELCKRLVEMALKR